MPSPYGRGEDNPDEPPAERSTEVVQGVTGGDTRFQVFARVVGPVRLVGVTIKADVPDDDLRVESWHAIWAGANWHERETSEMFGIGFVGHPDPRHIYLPGDFEGFPLRKDFPLLSRMVKPWPGIVDVEPMPEEEAAEAAAEVTAPTAAAATGDEAAAADAVADATSAPEPPSETDAASAPEQAAEPADVTDRTAETAPDQEPAAEPVAATPEEPADPTPEDVPPADVPADPTPEDPPAEPVAAPAEPRPDAEAAGTGVADVESAPEEGTAVAAPTPEAADGSWSPDIPVADVEGPFGPGSKAARPDASAPPDHPIKADSATRRFHVPGSEAYESVVADVWFDSETAARTAGFHSPYDDEESSS
jgi:NADH-quinone oxidoreductase subunit C